MSGDLLSKFAKAFSIFGVIAFAASGAVFLLSPDKILSTGDPTLLASQYLAGRNFAVAFFLFVAMYMRERRPLTYLLFMAAAFEAFDAGIGVAYGEPDMILPSVVFAVGFLLSALYFNQGSIKKVSKKRKK